MKKFLIAVTVLAVMGVATGWAQDYAKDKFEDFTARMKAAKMAQQDENNPLGPSGDLPMGGQPTTPEELQAQIEQQAADTARQQAANPPPDPFANMVVAKSSIKAVTVYSNRAKVTRLAELEVPEGSHTIAFKDLPAGLLPDSLRAEGSARIAVKFGAIAQKQIMGARLVPPNAQTLYEKIQTLRDQKEVITSEKTALSAQEEFLKNIGQQATLRNNENLAQIDLKPEQWAAAAQTIHNGLADIYKAALRQNQKLRDLELEINKAQRELDQISNGQRNILAVLVPIEAEKATKLTIEISYQMPNATWKPIYDARVNTDGKSDLKLAQYGSVRQQTGEDWTGVALTLSTAQPQRGASLPDLRPMWVDGFDQAKLREQNMKAAREASASGAAFVPTPIAPAENQTLMLPGTPSAPSGDPLAEWRAKTEAKRMQMEEPPRQARFTPAQINTGGFVSEYKIPGPANVPSDGSETKLLVGNFDVESKLQVHIKPQMSTEAYLVVHSKLKGDAPILPGQVNLFRDEAYVGQSNLPLLRPDEEYDLYFGVDDQVAVKRKVLKDESKQAGLIAKDNILERNFVTELQNLHKTPVDIVVKETVPSPRNEKIKVEVAKDTTTPGYVADADNIKGLLNWQFKMEPKEKKELKLDWTVSWPSEFNVTGL
jgi:hypothetical protein